MEENFLSATVDQIVHGLVGPDDLPESGPGLEPAALDIVVSGTIDEVQGCFIDRGWTDGHPIVPPTVDRVERFLDGSGHDPWKTLGVAASSGRDLTIWSIAVNAVMAGCVSEHLPVLVAMAEILADPRYGVEHSGNTTGADALVILNGPNASALGFWSGQGVMREGQHANTSVGRWLRLYLRNVFGFTSDEHDKATFGNPARVVMAEDYRCLEEIGWLPLSTNFGFDQNDDVATMARMNSGTIVGSVFGSTPDEIVPYLANGLVRTAAWDLTHVYGLGHDQFQPLLVLSPLLARLFAKAGWSKSDVQRALFDHARIEARTFESFIGRWTNLTASQRSLTQLVADGHLPHVFAESNEQDRLVPIVTCPERLLIAVAGDPTRANAYALSNDGPHGWWTAKRIDLVPATDLVCDVGSR